MKKLRDNCSFCGRSVATYIPQGGDGSVREAHTHRASGTVSIKTKAATPCQGSNAPTEHFGGNKAR